MNHLKRVKALLNQVKKKHKIKDKINIKIIKARTHTKRNAAMSIERKKIPLIRVYPENPIYKFERVPDQRIRNILAHELVHFLCFKYSREKDPRQLRSVLGTINKMIDCK